MKTNVAIELDDEQRKILAQRMGHSRLSKSPLATREEINLVVKKCVIALVSVRERPDGQAPAAGDDWFDEYLAETCRGAVFGEAS